MTVRARMPICIFVLVSILLAGPLQALAADDPYAPILPPVRDEVIERTKDELSSYDFTLALDPNARTISGSERIDYINQTGRLQSTIELRLYPNADYYQEGGIEIERIEVQGERVTPRYSAQDTVMSIPLEESVKPGEHRHVELSFTTTIPADSDGTFGIFSFDSRRGTWILADWYPILAGWEPGKGLVLDPPSPLGDPTFSDAAFYDLWLTVPNGWTVVASGVETATEPLADRTTWNIVSGPVREMTLVLDDDFDVLSKEVNGTTVSIFIDGEGDALAGAEIALEEAVAALEVFSEEFGAYPYDELDLVETEMNGVLGVSWTGLVFLNGDQFLSSSFYVYDEPERLRFTVAHEIGHQWWGALVGINSNNHSFLLEGLTNYLAVVAIERTEGIEAAGQQLVIQCVQPYLRALEQSGDGIADTPITVEATGASRGSLIYGKSALGFLAIRKEIGDDAFFGAISAWAGEFAFKIASPADLLRAFENESEKELDDLWRFWFQSAETMAADVEALLN